jgi:hypothetical protein
MNIETMVIGSGLIAIGLYDTYFATPENEIPYIGWIGEIFMLSGGALLVGHARDGENPAEAMSSVVQSMITVKGMK